MSQQNDLFGELHVRIKDNSVLEKAANRILLMVQRDPTLLDGDTIGAVDRRIFAEVIWEDVFQNLISPDKKSVFIKAILQCPESDVFTRARRFLQNSDKIRLSAKAVQSGERFRAKISSAMR